MTEGSGAERQPRDQDAGARHHPQPPAAVLAGRPRPVQGRSRPGAAPRAPPRTASSPGPAAAEQGRRCRPAHGVCGGGGMRLCRAAGRAPGRGGRLSLVVRSAKAGRVRGGNGCPRCRDYRLRGARRGKRGLRAVRGATAAHPPPPPLSPPRPAGTTPRTSCIGCRGRRWAAGAPGRLGQGSAGLISCCRAVAARLEGTASHPTRGKEVFIGPGDRSGSGEAAGHWKRGSTASDWK